MSFIRNVATLMTGTIVAQVIPIAVSPLLTRIYTPEDFGLVAIYIAITSVIAVVATLRYELAIAQPIEDEDAKALVSLSLLIVVFISMCTFIFAYLYNFFSWSFIGSDEIGNWLYLTPISVFIVGLYNVFNYWSLRCSDYSLMSKSKVLQGSGIAASQTVMGATFLTGGLVFGQITGQLFSVLFLIKKSTEKQKKILVLHDSKRITLNAVKYKNMPLFSSIGAFADNLSQQMPVFMISRFFGDHVTGMFSLTFRVLNLPLSFVSAALSQVLYRKIIASVNIGATDLYPLIFKLFFGLLSLILPFGFLVWLLGEMVFAFVFGEPWREAGRIASILVVAVMIHFVVSPLSTILSLNKNIRLGMLWQLTYFITITTTMVYFGRYNMEIFLYAFVIHEIILYLLYFVLILVGVKNLQRNS